MASPVLGSEASGTASSVMHATDGVFERKEVPEHTSLDPTIIANETKVEFRLIRPEATALR